MFISIKLLTSTPDINADVTRLSIVLLEAMSLLIELSIVLWILMTVGLSMINKYRMTRELVGQDKRGGQYS